MPVLRVAEDAQLLVLRLFVLFSCLNLLQLLGRVLRHGERTEKCHSHFTICHLQSVLFLINFQ